jgi:hypothetical protein
VATVERSSSDESKCTVSQDGVVTALGPGWCTIYAQCGAVKAECMGIGILRTKKTLTRGIDVGIIPLA